MTGKMMLENATNTPASSSAGGSGFTASSAIEPTEFLNGKVHLHKGDCLKILPTLPENSLDACVTDPPYGLQFMGREWDKLWRNETEADQAYVERTNGQLTSRARKLPDYSASKPTQMQEFHLAWAKEVFRVLKPGAHLLAFSGTRTYHRMACAIEDAGFEIRDQIGWCYGSGFPKSHNIGNGWGTALKPAWEPVVLARKPISEASIAANVLRWGTGALNIDQCRVETRENLNGGAYSGNLRQRDEYTSTDTEDGAVPLSRFNRGVGEYKQPQGRWPANLIHDGSDEVVKRFPETESAHSSLRGERHSGRHGGLADLGDNIKLGNSHRGIDDSGCSAARFFYTAKADTDDRLGSRHPTVKPLDLIGYLIRLITPPGGLVIDPFAGTGTTAEAAFREGCCAILIEREPEYQSDIAKRMNLCLSGPDERRAKSIKQEGHEGLPLFASPISCG